MTTTLAPPTLSIALESECTIDDGCASMAEELYAQLDGGRYTWPMSALELPLSEEDYLGTLRTARKRAWRAEAYGYHFDAIERAFWLDDIHAINTSLAERQGRPMSEGYQTRPTYALLEQPCERHRINAYGVTSVEQTLVAYAFVYRCGQLALVSQILGHGDHLEAGVMFLLLVGVVRRETRQRGVLVYNRHDSGTDGLRWFKERFGFRPTRLEWQA